MGVLWLGILIWAMQTLLWQASAPGMQPASIAELKVDAVEAKHVRDLSLITTTISFRDHGTGGKNALLGAEHAAD